MQASRRVQRTQGTAAALLIAANAPQLLFLVLRDTDRVGGVASIIFSTYAILGAIVALCAIPVLFTSHRVPGGFRHATVTTSVLTAVGFAALGILAAVRDRDVNSDVITFEFGIFACALALLAYRVETSARAIEAPAPSGEQKRVQLRERFAELQGRGKRGR